MHSNERNTFVLLGGSASAIVTVLVLLFSSYFFNHYPLTFSQTVQSMAVVVIFYILVTSSLIYAKYLPKKSFALFPIIGLITFVAVQFQNLVSMMPITLESLAFSLILSLAFACFVPFIMIAALVKAEILH